VKQAEPSCCPTYPKKKSSKKKLILKKKAVVLLAACSYKPPNRKKFSQKQKPGRNRSRIHDEKSGRTFKKKSQLREILKKSNREKPLVEKRPLVPVCKAHLSRL
jgi:hypothetical protein